jgi:hypothetical protein
MWAGSLLNLRSDMFLQAVFLTVGQGGSWTVSRFLLVVP